jgi:hypothetical protein
MTNKARLREKLFKTCGSEYIMSPNKRLTSWSGLHNNPWLPCRFFNSCTTVEINGQEFKIDPDDWECEGGHAVLYTIEKQERKYIQHKSRANRGKYNKVKRDE